MGAAHEEYRPGSIYTLKKCPPLHGTKIKDRPVVVVSVLRHQDRVVIVAVTTSDEDPPKDQVELPSKATDPRTGLDEPSAAIPQWYLLVSPKRLGSRKIGDVPPELFARILQGVRARTEAWHPPVKIDSTVAADDL